MQFRIQGEAVCPDHSFMGPIYWGGGRIRTAGLDAHRGPRKSTVSQLASRVKGRGQCPAQIIPAWAQAGTDCFLGQLRLFLHM